jgi:hypothetical protein
MILSIFLPLVSVLHAPGDLRSQLAVANHEYNQNSLRRPGDVVVTEMPFTGTLACTVFVL